MCCTELSVTFWTAMRKDELSIAPSHFLDMCCPQLPVTLWTASTEDMLLSAPCYFFTTRSVDVFSIAHSYLLGSQE
jgi:hypothetical protein